MGRHRQIVSSTPKLPSRTLSESELSQIREQLQHYQGQPDMKPEQVTKVMGNWVRQQLQVQPGTAAWAQYIRVLRDNKIQTNGGTAARGGRKSYAETIPDFKNIIWTQSALGKTYPDIIQFLIEKKKLKAEDAPNERTIRRFLEKNPVPENFGALGELQDSEEFKKWQTYMKERKRVGLGQLEHLRDQIINMFLFLHNKNPKLWTVEDLRAYEKHQTTRLKGSSMRAVVNAVRSFAEYGLEQPTWLKEFITSPYPKRSYSVIYAFSFPGFQNLLKYIPTDNYSFEFKTTDGHLITRSIDLTNSVYRAEIYSWISFTMAIGARNGALGAGSEVLHALQTGKMSHMNDHGSVSVRISDINWPKMKLKQIYDKWHKQADKAWTDISIPPKTYEALKHYLVARFSLLSELSDEKFAETMTQLAAKANGEFQATEAQIMEQVKAIFQSDKPEHQKRDEITHLWQERNRAFEKIALFPHEPDYYNSAIYCAVDNALKHGEPVSDNQDGAPWTPQRIYDEKHVAHLLRKTFAQYLIDNDVPLEVVASIGVGWDDLSTLFAMYGKVSKAKVKKYYDSIISQQF